MRRKVLGRSVNNAPGGLATVDLTIKLGAQGIREGLKTVKGRITGIRVDPGSSSAMEVEKTNSRGRIIKPPQRFALQLSNFSYLFLVYYSSTVIVSNS